MSIKIGYSLDKLFSETIAELVRKYSLQERLDLMYKMLKSAWCLIPCEPAQYDCKDCKYKQFCDELLKVAQSAQKLVKTNETL